MLDADESRRRKIEGMQLALDFAGQWVDMAMRALRVYAEAHETFTAEAFRYDWLSAGGVQPHAHKAWGALFSRAAREGLITKTGRYVPARSAKTHAHPVPVWRSK